MEGSVLNFAIHSELAPISSPENSARRESKISQAAFLSGCLDERVNHLILKKRAVIARIQPE